MVCGGWRRTAMSATRSAVATVALASAVVLSLAARPATAFVNVCTPMDLTAHNVTDYIRWSNTSDRLYLQTGACVTLTDVWESRLEKYGNNGPVYPFDENTKSISNSTTGSWYLASSLYITDGSKLMVQGTAFGGDCDHLLLASNPSKFINMRAHGGSIWIEGAHVESWDMGAGTVDENDLDGRSYISAISEVALNSGATCIGAAKSNMGEARLDILDSHINHLGWFDSESYGIAYKVRGFCKDHSNPEVFDAVSVTGDILRSHIHNLYFGHYSYGHQGGNFSFNEVHDNIGYGFDPHDDSDYLTIHNNHVYNNGWHGIIASKRCDHVSIQNNIVHNNGKNGLMLHRSCDFATVKNNTAYGNVDAGIALYESSNCDISENNFYWNKYGIRMSMGSSDNSAHNNRILINGEEERYGIFLYRGADEPAVVGSDGRPRNNHLLNNSLISDNEGIKLMDCDNNLVEGNTITGRLSRFKNATQNLWLGNRVPKNYEFKMHGGACFQPASDMNMSLSDVSLGALSSHSWSYQSEFDEGFFCT